MDFDKDKVDDATLALLWLVMSKGRFGGVSAWKGFDWDTMDRLFEKGYISDPKRKTKSVGITEEGERRAKELFEEMFGGQPPR